jgi:hypothetical protein
VPRPRRALAPLPSAAGAGGPAPQLALAELLAELRRIRTLLEIMVYGGSA